MLNMIVARKTLDPELVADKNSSWSLPIEGFVSLLADKDLRSATSIMSTNNSDFVVA
jgi:hypothetical protein